MIDPDRIKPHIAQRSDREDVTQIRPNIPVRKHTSYVQVPHELIHDLFAKTRPMTRHERAKSRLSRTVARLRMRLGSWIAGQDLDYEDD